MLKSWAVGACIAACGLFGLVQAGTRGSRVRTSGRCGRPRPCRRIPDDPAIWVNRADPSKSLVFGTMKVAAPDGALAVFGLDGKLRQLLKGPDRPNNVDVEYGSRTSTPRRPTSPCSRNVSAGGCASTRFRATARRCATSLRRTMPILEGARGDEGAPMGIGLYKPAEGRRDLRDCRRRRPGRRQSLPLAVPPRRRRHRTREGDVRAAVRRLQRRRRDRSDRRRRRARVRLLRRRGRRHPQMARRSGCAGRRPGARAVRHDRLPAGSRRPRHLHDARRQGLHRVGRSAARRERVSRLQP